MKAVDDGSGIRGSGSEELRVRFRFPIPDHVTLTPIPTTDPGSRTTTFSRGHDVRHRIAIIIGLLAATACPSARSTRGERGRPSIVTASVTRGPIVNAIAAAGTLEAVTTVQVGSQVSGTIQSLGADFNSIVRKGQVIARLDPSLFQTQVDSARANLASAQADLQRAQVTLATRRLKATRHTSSPRSS